jgi:hypothetical protein
MGVPLQSPAINAVTCLMVRVAIIRQWNLARLTFREVRNVKMHNSQLSSMDMILLRAISFLFLMPSFSLVHVIALN